jgi:two-component system sensor histidine kinase VanS
MRIEQRDLAVLIHQTMGPLASISLSAEYLRAKPRPEEQQKIYLDRIHAEARMAINQLQSFQAVTLLLQAEPLIFRSNIDLAQEIKRAAALFSPLARERDLELRLEGLERLPRRFSADSKLMQVLFFIVLDNALRYSLKTTPILIKARRPKDSAVIVEFINQGFPISDAEKSRVFDYGYRSAIALAVNPVGTGRGLFLAKRIVEAHGGEISLQSHSKDLNVVSIKLPFDREDGAG